MLRVQRLIPRIPPRILGPLLRLMGSRRFVRWSFNHYLRDRPAQVRQGSRPRATARASGAASCGARAEHDLVGAE